ncbi:MAG: D-tyrosyl-tRNA(Tyr) deacylase [Acidobacteriaceae bacterium]|nr:D-tyrosyl-tRNA(Tyr) deacylase [Acidobacteriaceae bacterium]
MRALVQRVSEANVSVDGLLRAQIGPGLLVFVGIGRGDTRVQAEYLAKKVANLRVFPDSAGKMNRSLVDVSGEMLVVSQFTLYGDTKKGLRPSYSEAADPNLAEELYEYFVAQCRTTGVPVSTGVFQAQMKVRLINDGPVTLMCDAER